MLNYLGMIMMLVHGGYHDGVDHGLIDRVVLDCGVRPLGAELEEKAA